MLEVVACPVLCAVEVFVVVVCHSEQHCVRLFFVDCVAVLVVMDHVVVWCHVVV